MKIRKILSIALAGIVMLSTLALGSCGEEKDYPVTVGKIKIEQEPKNIVILNKNLADIITAIGYDGKTVGRSDEVNQKSFKVVPSVGSAQDPLVDKIKKAKAEIVFADKTLCQSALDKLKESSIPVFQPEDAHTLKQLKVLYKQIGSILGGNVVGNEKAMKSYSEIKNTLKTVRTAAKRDKTVSTLAYLYIDDGAIKTVTGSTWRSSMLSFTGSMNVFEKAESDVVDPAKLVLANPDCIFVADESVKEHLNLSDTLKKLRALDGNTFVISYDDLGMQGYTSLDVIQEMIGDITDADIEETSEAAAE